MIETDVYEGLVTDGDHILDAKAPFSLEGMISLTFYSDEYETPVAPTGGTVTVTLSEDGFNYGTISNGTITFPVVSYARPSYFGYAIYAKATLAGVTGATHFRMRVHNGK